MSDIGRTHITLQRQTARGQKTYLLRVDTHLEGSSVFIYVSRDTDQWPLRLRNDTGISLKFQQVVSQPLISMTSCDS